MTTIRHLCSIGDLKLSEQMYENVIAESAYDHSVETLEIITSSQDQSPSL
jgi:predicted nucleic acid-binding protein